MSFVGLDPDRCRMLAADLRLQAANLISMSADLRAIDAQGQLAMAARPSALLVESADEYSLAATLLESKAAAMVAVDRGGSMSANLEARVAAAYRGLEASLSDGVGDQRLAQEQREETIRRYQDAAFRAAGIDPLNWVPSLGANANAANIEAVYTYYGQLFLNHPELQWAGMANMIGPSFAAGFFDLAMIRGLATTVGSAAEKVPFGTLPISAEALSALAKMTDADLRFFETTFLEMQKSIFLDQATTHQAYVSEGLAGVKALFDARMIDAATYKAWTRIDIGKVTGNATLIAQGNEQLLWREQHDIIDNAYIRMYRHSPTGPAMTYLMTLIGSPSIPGANAMAAVSPITMEITTPGPRKITTPESVGTPRSVFGHKLPSVSVGIPHLDVDNPTQLTATVITPFPNANVALFDDRWKLIQLDTLPAYRRVLANPARARALVATPVDQRIDQYRLLARIDDLLKDLLDFRLKIRQ
jgi:hypothetical protein